MPERDQIEQWYRGFQRRFVDGLSALDPAFDPVEDVWTRPGGGGGLTIVGEDHPHIEKAAVNFSAVHGDTPAQLSDRLAEASSRFFATGVSIIVHPRNPYAPTFHANVRYFETDTGEAWFGGGADLTPHYLFPEDATSFHTELAQVCGAHPVADYAAWKQACDEYFYLHHRGEARGVGGVFFDHLREDRPAVWDFQRDFAMALLDAYPPILGSRKDIEYGERERRWQLYRRGRYVEFNLVWDRGTRFGLETNGRTESILGSLPPAVRWEYDHQPEPGSPEHEMQALLSGPPRDWVDVDSLLNSGATNLDGSDV